MHFHLPKPLHGWREFLGEVGIIVIGVLIALGAEQVVGSIHNHVDANDARAKIDAEVVTDITRINQRAMAYECAENRLNEIDQIIDGAAAEGRIQQPSWIGRPTRYAIETARWDAASQSGRISRLPSDWQGEFGFLYTALKRYSYVSDEEQQVWSRLEALEGVDRLTADGKLAIKADVAEARYLNFQARQVANVIFLAAARQGLRPTSRRDPPFGVCWPITTPTAQGRAMVAKRSTVQWLERFSTRIYTVPGH
jgi:hypothetical protein